MNKQLLFVLISLFFVSCSGQVSVTNDVIVLGVVRTSFNLKAIYATYTNGAGVVKLQLPANIGSDPDWSPDGNWIVSSTEYQVRNPKESKIYLMLVDGSRRSLIADHIGGSFHPTWSPDGTKIAYSARDSEVGVYILDVECFKRHNTKCTPQPIFITSGDYATPDWSPDGKHIAYEKDGNILVIDSDGKKQPVNLTPNMTECRSPKWSPNGEKIVFSCYLPDRFDVFSANMINYEITNLTNGYGSNILPQWSPDGSRIAFISNRGTLGQIISNDTVRSNAVFLMDSDGNNVAQLSLRDDEHVLWIAWLPK